MQTCKTNVKKYDGDDAAEFLNFMEVATRFTTDRYMVRNETVRKIFIGYKRKKLYSLAPHLNPS